jgi:hypothetical protein
MWPPAFAIMVFGKKLYLFSQLIFRRAMLAMPKNDRES